MATTTMGTGTFGTQGAAATSGTANIQTGQAVDRVHGGVDRLAQGAHDTVDRIVDKARPTADRARDTVSNINTTIYTKFDDLINSEDWAESARSEIRAHPLAIVGIALVAGLFIGRL